MVEETKKVLAEAESEFEKVWGYKHEPFPWGGTLRYCPFLKWMGNKWYSPRKLGESYFANDLLDPGN